MASEGLTGALAAVLAGQGPSVQSCDSAPAGEPPVPVRLRKNVCYVVLAVFLSEQDEVLLIQEAKRECRGSWYLPAGRMEPGETIVEALQREVKEEAGLHCGILKTSKEADAESLQAAWYPRSSLPTPLRAHDILHLVELAAQYRQQARHPVILPQSYPGIWSSSGSWSPLPAPRQCGCWWAQWGFLICLSLPVPRPCGQRGGMKMAILRLLQSV
ncbi:hypothetical protein H8958_021973 [Nasalis larvatus]